MIPYISLLQVLFILPIGSVSVLYLSILLLTMIVLTSQRTLEFIHAYSLPIANLTIGGLLFENHEVFKKSSRIKYRKSR
ncbi:hypothetical protein SAMN06265379_11423 [Saccharicrinis carchari]|uniref:Uncharacterized protein n=1 Tax=Saccharicrinis carchari TaxID=1168039 RepID=A0A521F5E7_SACCC|nr:hypothetical protein SAMN06265379_11423 [Saccharicrinis carchari]